MPGPIGQALDDYRRRHPRRHRVDGWFVFVGSTLALSWCTAVLVGFGAPAGDGPFSVRLLAAALFYIATMGWQPIVAAWIARRLCARRGEPPTSWPAMRELGLATVVPIGLASLAMVVARIAGESPQRLDTLDAGAGPALAAASALLVLCVQSLGEEYGWRGAPMSYAIERWGTRRGLVVHGMTWGCWYAPLFVLSSPAPVESLLPTAGFVVTCMLLGIVFGWLRLRSGSILPPAIANAILTIVGGLPLLLHDGSVGIRDAVFRWPGLPVLGLVALALLLGRRRDFSLE